MAAVADPSSFRSAGYVQNLARALGLTGFGRWWIGELRAALPAPLRAALERRRTRPVLAFDGSRATLWRATTVDGRNEMRAVAEIPLYADADIVASGGRVALAPLAQDGAPELVVALSPRNALRKRLTLPAAVEPNLHQALAYDLDRHTPFKADELYFDAAIVDRDPARNTLHVDLAAARRAVVDPLLRHAESFGARVVAVTIEPPASAALSRLNLLPEERRTGEGEGKRWRLVVPVALLSAAILAALVLPVWQKRDQAITLLKETDEARQRATASDALRTELERRVGDYNFALERKYAFPGVVQVLDDVTRILPDDTWLTQLELRSVRGKDGQRELTLRGESANAGRLVTLLEDSKLFTQTAPRSPTTKIQPGPGEIFDVGAQLKPLPPPPAMPLEMTPPARPPAPAAPPPPSATAAPPTVAVPSPTQSPAAPTPAPPSPPNAAASAPAAVPPAPPAAMGPAAPGSARSAARNIAPGAAARSAPAAGGMGAISGGAAQTAAPPEPLEPPQAEPETAGEGTPQ